MYFVGSQAASYVVILKFKQHVCGLYLALHFASMSPNGLFVC